MVSTLVLPTLLILCVILHRTIIHVPYHYQKEIRLPKAVSPKFDGSNPKVWREKCEKYFNMYHILIHLWAQFATIHFKGSAELWLQTTVHRY